MLTSTLHFRRHFLRPRCRVQKGGIGTSGGEQYPRRHSRTVRYPKFLPNLLQVIILAVVQGLAELLPVSSSAHVIVAEKLMGLAPSAPAMTLLLVMLHTGTMFAVIVYFWK